MQWFYPHIPPSYLARPVMSKVLSKNITDLSEFFGDDTVNDPEVSYSINSLGYRYEEFDNNYDSIIVSLGMSCTFGIGVKKEETYSDIISKKLNMPVLNFGIPGASSDSVARMIGCIVPYWKQRSKKLVVVLGWPYSQRREIFLDDFKASINFQNKPPIKEYYKLLDNTANAYNLEKNMCFAESVCKSNNVPVYEVPQELYLSLDIDKSNDGYHPGPVWHKTVAKWFLENQKDFLH